ncbi:hypothetical protein SLE2022_162920 [Rubroshorea leprosula]
MSSSSEFSGQKPARLPEKPRFTQTCSLLSQYLKEKGSFGDLNLGMKCNVEANAGGPAIVRQPPATTMNLFPVKEKPSDVYAWNIAEAPRSMKSMDLFPQQAGFSFPVSKDEGLKMDDTRSVKVEQPQTAEMTIFYGGQVIVFNDFPADKAKEIMQLAGQGSSQTQSNNSFPTNLAKSSPVESCNGIPPASNAIPSFGNNMKQDSIQLGPSQPVVCDLPIKRRASLHRFLEKRKDRITTRAPYQTGASLSKPADGKSWLGLAAQSPQ